MIHDYVYLHVVGKDKIPLLTGGSRNLGDIIFPKEDIKKVVYELANSKDNLYVWVDGTIFKLL